MNHKHQRDVQLISVLTIATLFVAFFTMAALSNFKLGLHFDKDMRVIAEVENRSLMEDFAKAKQTQGYETDMVISNNDIAILNISGVEDSEGFTKELKTEVPGTKILLLGSFGSMTKFSNNQSFIAISLIVICLVILAYHIILNRLFGWYKALEVILIALAPLYFVNSLGYVLSVTLWYSVLSVFLIFLVLSDRFYDSFTVRVLSSITIFAIGLFLYISNIQRFLPVAYYWMGVGISSGVVLLLYHFLFLPLMTPYRYRVGIVPNRFISSSLDGPYTKVKLITAILLALSLSFLLSMARGQYDIKGDERGFYKELVISQSNNTNYLEIQALLSRLELFDEQLSYLVSEQGQTWIEFSPSVSLEDLKEAQYALMNEYQIHSVYFDGVPPINYFNTQIMNVMIVAVSVAMAVFLLLSEGIKSAGVYLFEVMMSLTAYSIFVHLAKLQNNQVWLLGLLLLPLFLIILNLDFKQRRTGSYYIESIIASAILLALFSLPVFVIVPSAVSAELIFYFMFLMIAAYFGIGISLLTEHFDIGGPHEPIES